MNQSEAAMAIDRREFVADLMAQCPEALVITGLGSPSYDVFAAGDRPRNFYLWGAMGGAAGVGLGLALAQPEQSVVVITGDGEQLMGLGCLATIGVKNPKNLTIVVLDNGHFGETGMQRSHTSLGTDLVAVAQSCSIPHTALVRDMADVPRLAERIHARSGTALVQVIIKPDDVQRALPPRDGIYLKNRLRHELGFPVL